MESLEYVGGFMGEYRYVDGYAGPFPSRAGTECIDEALVTC